MKKDEALALARKQRDKTSVPQAVGMRSDGTWYVMALTSKRTDEEQTRAAWERYALADAIAQERGQ